MLRIIDVPSQLMLKMPIKYPPHQGRNPMIEEKFFIYFKKNFKQINSDYVYLPVQWTSFHLKNNYGENVQPLIDYQNEIIKQMPNEKFFTIVQYDGGTLVPLDNCRVFACSGSFNSPIGTNSSYEAIPLYSDPHRRLRKNKKKYKVVFCGRITHDLRKLMLSTLNGITGYYLYDPGGVEISKKDVKTFRELVGNSLFGLCPRGYGPTSFRLYETIQMGCIPIIISDEFWLPFEQYISWNKIALLVTPDRIAEIPVLVNNLIDSGDYETMLEYGKYCYENYFSWKGIRTTVQRIIESD